MKGKASTAFEIYATMKPPFAPLGFAWAGTTAGRHGEPAHAWQPRPLIPANRLQLPAFRVFDRVNVTMTGPEQVRSALSAVLSMPVDRSRANVAAQSARPCSELRRGGGNAR